MPRTCTVCTHAQRRAIDRALVLQIPFRNIAPQFDLSPDAVYRHGREHLPALLAKAQEAEDAAAADDLLAQLRALQSTTLTLLEKAESAGKLGTAIMAVREARGNLELLAKLTQQLDTRPTLNLLVAPEWLTVRAVLLEVLSAYPEARVAVAGRLAALEAGHGVWGRDDA